MNKVRTDVKGVGCKKFETVSTASTASIRNRVLGRRKVENVWEDNDWIVKGRLHMTSDHTINRSDYERLDNRINLKLV